MKINIVSRLLIYEIFENFGLIEMNITRLNNSL
jgi:hypothetical protein